MYITEDGLDFRDPYEREIILQQRREELAEKLKEKKERNKTYLKGQRGVRRYYDYDRPVYEDKDGNEIREIKCVYTRDKRRKSLFKYLKYLKGKKVLVRDLAWKYAVTERTIQSDLKYLIDNGFIERQTNKTHLNRQTKNSYIVHPEKEKDFPFDDDCFVHPIIVAKQNDDYVSYMHCVDIMKKFFKDSLKLKDVTYHHLLEFYDYLKNERGNKNVTIKHHAVILSPALRQAYRDDLIAKNPYEFMPPIKREKSRMSYYNKDELEELFKFTDNSPLKLIVRVAAYYGFRRSELIGLKWEAIDFEQKMITIQHKVLNVEGVLYLSDTLKTTSSHRTLPLLPEIEELLLERKAQIEHNKFIFGSSFNTKYQDYVFVDDIGDLFNPDQVSDRFNNILKKNNLRHIRFHDLRHSCASLLVASKIPMKNIQEWLGHSNFSTTADVYSHLDYTTKYESANAINQALTQNKDEKQVDEESKQKTKQELEDEISRLQELIKEQEEQERIEKEREEKRKQKKREQAEM